MADDADLALRNQLVDQTVDLLAVEVRHPSHRSVGERFLTAHGATPYRVQHFFPDCRPVTCSCARLLYLRERYSDLRFERPVFLPAVAAAFEETKGALHIEQYIASVFLSPLAETGGRRGRNPHLAQKVAQVSEILTTGVRLDLPRPMDPMDETEAGIESLFEAVCQVDRTCG